MHGNRTHSVKTAKCRRCGNEYGEEGLKAAFGWCLDCHARVSLSPEMPFFTVTCKATWVQYNGDKTFFFKGKIYKRADWPEWMIKALIGGFKPTRDNGQLSIAKYYLPLKEENNDGNR